MLAQECSNPDCLSRLHYKEEVIGDRYVFLEWAWSHLKAEKKE